MALKDKKDVKKIAPKQKNSKRTIVNSICIVILSMCMITSVAGFVLVNNILNESSIAQGINGLTSEDSTQLFDDKDEVFKTLSSESGVRENIPYEEMPQVVIDAIIATEDSRFFKHGGFDLPRFVKAGYENILKGGIAQGGSTLTMQLVDVKLFSEEEKATFGIKEKLEQKVVEIFKSMEIESKMDKEKVLENYLNAINFGGPARGIQKAAQYYFDKDAKNLTLSEAAFLAGVINAPGAYNPYGGADASVDYYKRAINRRNDVLYLMNRHGYISKEEEKIAKSTELAFQLTGEKSFGTVEYAAFSDEVIKEAKAITGKNPHTTAMRIYTNMNTEVQAYADSLYDPKNGLEFPDELFQAGFAAINNQTGEIKALGGGRSFTGTDNSRNRATSPDHQPGSTAKPILDYAPAFEYLPLSTEHVFEDGPVEYPDPSSTMWNADRQFRGDVTFRTALGQSLNIPAYKTMKDVYEKIGKEAYVELINKMGIESITEENFALGMSIGGAGFSISPLQLSGAFSTFANQGDYIKPYTIRKIEFLDEDIEDYEVEAKEEKVFSEETAFLMSHMLKQVVDDGYGLVGSLKSNYPVYGKSGTTDFGPEAAEYGIPEGIAKDKWMVGYTNQYTVACWAGYDYPIAGKNTYLDEYKLYLNIEGRVVKALLDKLVDPAEAATIQQPDGVVSISHIQGLYPYATATNNDGSSMVSGLINRKFAKLESVTADDISPLKADDFNMSATNNTLSLAFKPYPDEKMLIPFSGTKTMNAGGVSVSGVQMFSKTKLFGVIKYMYQIYVNGNVVDSGSSDKEKFTKKINSKNGDTVKVCGYYGYSNAKITSDQVCKTITSQGLDESYSVDASFDAVFNSTNSYEDAYSSIASYMQNTLPDVKFTIIKSPDVASGKLDKEKSTIYAGKKVFTGNTYTIAIGM